MLFRRECTDFSLKYKHSLSIRGSRTREVLVYRPRSAASLLDRVFRARRRS